ncbi:hypothetical protein XENOCAPTIV_027114, partial [Xenoophorus captivus]
SVCEVHRGCCGSAQEAGHPRGNVHRRVADRFVLPPRSCRPHSYISTAHDGSGFPDKCGEECPASFSTHILHLSLSKLSPGQSETNRGQTENHARLLVHVSQRKSGIIHTLQKAFGADGFSISSSPAGTAPHERDPTMGGLSSEVEPTLPSESRGHHSLHKSTTSDML